jgi:hypothetical protein
MTDLALPVEATQVLLFARAVGMTDAGAGDPVVPPTFTETLQHFIPGYPFRPEPGQAWTGSRAEPIESSTLHAEQHFDYHRPIRVGETLTAVQSPGRTWTRTGRRGALQFTEQVTTFLDAAGEPVVTSRQVGVEVSSGSST